MRNLRNYYRILHVERDAPAAVIKGSYRTLMQTLRHHPDLGGDAWNAQLLNEAMATLGDPVARARYDATLADHPSGPALRDAPADRDRGEDTRSEPEPPDAGSPGADPDDGDPDGDDAGDTGPDGGDGDARRDASREGPARAHRSRRGPPPGDVPSSRTLSVPLTASPPTRRCPFCDRVTATPDDAPLGGYAAASACGGCGGPIEPPRTGIEVDGATERRRSPRLDHETAATLRRRSRISDGVEDVTLLELSGTGCLLASAAPIPLGEIVLLRARTLSAIGTVCCCDASARGSHQRVALAFLTIELHASAGSFVSRAV